GEPVTPLLRHAAPVTAATLCGDGNRLVSVSADNTAWLWQVSAQPPPPIAMHHAAQINTVACSGDGAIVVTASDDNTARTWSARTGEQLHAPLIHDQRVTSAAINRDGTRIATTVSDGMMAGIWNVATGARVAAFRKDWTEIRSPTPGHTDLVTSATFSDDGSR